MRVRTYQPGDELVQAEIYNEAAAELAKYKPATADEVVRRTRAPDFDPARRCYAEEDGRVVGYCTFNANGRVSYPWCRKGWERAAQPLFQHVLLTVRQQGLPKLFAAYRRDWPVQQAFFLARGFSLVRDMVNFILDLSDMPTGHRHPPARCFPLKPADIPALLSLAPQALRVTEASALEQHLCANPYFTSDAVFVFRVPGRAAPVAAGILILNAAYADPQMVDPAMPCYRLGAFGTENMQTKRINGLFSVLARDDQDLMRLALAALDQAAFQLEQAGLDTLAAQVPSDVPHLLRFYEQLFRRQGSFPVLERIL